MRSKHSGAVYRTKWSACLAVTIHMSPCFFSSVARANAPPKWILGSSVPLNTSTLGMAINGRPQQALGHT